MNLDDLFGPTPNILKLATKDRWAALRELVEHLVASRRLKPEHRDGVIAAVERRERSMSTGIGFGIAMPHAATDLVSEPVWALGWSKSGIEFDALDGRPVDIVMLFLVPPGEFQTHSSTMARFAKLVNTDKFRSELRRRFGE